MDIKFIHKLEKDNLILDALNKKKEFMEEKFHDTMWLKIIVYSNDFLFIKDIKKDYKKYENVLKIKIYICSK